jgi:uncharacterized protein YfaS (alpha-2-macroglobulin family)
MAGAMSMSESAPAPSKPMKKAAPSGMKSKMEFADEDISGELAIPSADMEADKGYYAGADDGVADKEVTITIRTDFAETSFWEPHMTAEKGVLSFQATLPDSLTVQRLTLLASDKRGGSGVAHEEIAVSQDLYARSDLPATLTMGDTLQVQAAFRNNTGESVKAKLELDSEHFVVAGKSKVKVTAGPNGTAVARFDVRPRRAGTATYTVTASGKHFTDVEERTVYIRPAGNPVRTQTRDVLESGEPFEADVKLTGDEEYHTSFLHVTFPTAVPVLQGLEAMLSKPAGAIDFVASRALVAAAVYRYLQKNTKNEKALANVGEAVQLSLAGVLMSQRPDGGWGWNVNLLRLDDTGNLKKDVPKSNPYMTAQCLEALLEMKVAGLPVPKDAVRRTLDNLAEGVDSDGYWDMGAIATWEGSSNEVKVGMSAEIFKVMAYAATAFPEAANASGSYTATMDKIAPVYESYLKSKKAEPFALANAALGVFYDAKRSGGPDAKLDAKLTATADRLLNMRDEAHWEPGWFNAWGGTIEATEAALELMIRHDPDKYELELRRALSYILSTQSSFGDWHNARGTASAIRALLLLPPTKPEKPSTVTISVNGDVVRKVEIDPDDPFLSAVQLRMVELTGHMDKGKNAVKVTYDGNLEAPVSLVSEVWGVQAHAGLGGPDITLLRKYDRDAVDVNVPVEVTVKGAIKSRRVPLVVTEPLPACASVDPSSMDALVADGVISDWLDLGNAVQMTMAPSKKTFRLTYRITGNRSGKCVQAPTQVVTVGDVHSPAYGLSTKLEIE